MGAVWARVRVDLRRRRTGTVALVLLVGLAAGVVMASVAGARRTATALDRLVAYTRLPDASVQAPDAATATRVAALPQVVAADRDLFVFLSATQSGAGSGDVVPIAAADDHSLRTTNRLRVLDGHLPAVDAPFDVAVSPLTLQRLHLRLGDTFPLYAYGLAQLEASQEAGFGELPAPDGPTFTFRAVGVVRAPTDINPEPAQNVIYEGNAGVYLTPAFVRAYAADLGVGVDDLPGMEYVAVHLQNGAADLAAFEAAAGPILGSHGQIIVDNDVSQAVQSARRAVRFQSVALLAFATLGALAALVILGQAVARQVALDASDHPALAALGMTGRQLAAVAMARAAVVGIGGAVVGVVVAVALSPRFPVGLARTIEVDPGVSVDLAVLAAGVVATVVLVVGRGLVAAWRVAPAAVARAEKTPGRRSRLVAGLARAGLPVSAVAGVRMSVEPGRGPTAVPVRAAIAATAAAVAGVTAAVVFAVSLSHLTDDPGRQGWNWDVLVGNPNAQGDPASVIVPRLVSYPLVGGVAGIGGLGSSGGGGGLRIEGHDVATAVVQSFKGDVAPVVLAGRLPQGADEVAVGRSTLASLHRGIGDTVRAAAGDQEGDLRIVGTVLMPSAGDVLSPSLGTGALVSPDGAARLFPDAPSFALFAVRFAAGADPAAAMASIRRDFPREVLTHVTAPEVENLRRVSALPVALALLLVVLGLGVLAHALMTAVRRRRRDLAMLKTLGFLRRQVAATVAWQATATALASVVVGLPLGIALGRWVWAAMAAQVQAPADPAVPVAALAVAGAATVVLANLLAAGPGWVAARVRPAIVLRAE